MPVRATPARSDRMLIFPIGFIAPTPTGASATWDHAEGVALAEAGGYGYWNFADPANYVEGTGAGVGALREWLDQTTSQHIGTLQDYHGATSGDQGAITTEAPGYVSAPAGPSVRHFASILGGPIEIRVTGIFVFRCLSPLEDEVIIINAKDLGQNRPFFKFKAAVGGKRTWQFLNGGGSADDTSSSDGNNVGATSDIADGEWHCLLIHHSSQAAEGLIIDLDGERLIPDNTSYIQGDGRAAESWFTLGDVISTPNGVNRAALDYSAMVWGTDENVNTHAETRAIAEAMMVTYGITSRI